MQSPFSYYQEKKSTMAAKGVGGAVGGLIIIGVAIVAGVLCVPAAAIGGGVLAGLAIASAVPAAWGAGGTALAVIGGLTAAHFSAGIGVLAGFIVAGVGSLAGAIVGGVVAGVTKGIGAAAEGIFGLNRKRHANNAAKAKVVLPAAAPAVKAVSAFKASDVKAQFVAATTTPVAGNDNKAASKKPRTLRILTRR